MIWENLECMAITSLLPLIPRLTGERESRSRKEVSKLKCPSCGNPKTGTIDSRESDGMKRRRRACSSCGFRFTTYEIDSRQYEAFKKTKGLVKEADTIARKLIDLIELANTEDIE